ncbi:sigma factor-like helix-turn-helix DNA-binding protein [Streptomyces sp. NPDC048338]|uniref:sigma factor-like helix-turn-helix DNA-binding protein n=1 Tax=Streptomyces sp. NPDC048338 TaxID=3365536 RepID=UPI00371DB4B2
MTHVTKHRVTSPRTSTRRREDYIGTWLPEPLLLAENDASADVLLGESVSMAMLVLLETLTPDERAVFVLREVFGFEFRTVATAVGKPPVATVRQGAHRARGHVRARRKRFAPVDAVTTARITEQFLTAATTCDLDGLLSLLTPDVTWTADSGGKATEARRPVAGAEEVAAVLVSLFRLERLADLRIEKVNCNNTPALVLSGKRLEGVFLIEIADGRITDFYAIRNPDKLIAMAVPRQISREEQAVNRARIAHARRKPTDVTGSTSPWTMWPASRDTSRRPAKLHAGKDSPLRPASSVGRQ